jgi:flavin-dependent dehydrogenase
MIAKVDVAVVGGGPAGTAAAICAAQAGLQVALFESAQDEVDRPGETLPPGAEPLFRRLGVDDTIGAAATIRHDGHWVQQGRSRRFQRFGSDRDGAWLGYQIRRNALRKALIDRAEQVGVLVRRTRVLQPLSQGQTIVGIETAAETVMSRLLIDASGGSHWLARARGDLIERVSPQLIAWYGWAQTPKASDFARPVFTTRAAEWSWIAQVDGGLCAWVRLNYAPQQRERPAPPRQLKGFKPLGRPRGADVTWRMVARQGGDGFLCVGDAAAVLDPSSAHGVLRALLSGMMAAHHAVRIIRLGISDRDEAATFERWSHAVFLRDARALHELRRPAVSIGRTARDLFLRTHPAVAALPFGTISDSGDGVLAAAMQ